MESPEMPYRPAHEDAIEKQAEHDSLSQRIAIFTAILATVGAVVSFLGGHTLNMALFYKNEAVLMKTQATDQWNYYQAKGQKENLAIFASETLPDPEKQKLYAQKGERYAAEKAEILKKANEYEKKFVEADHAAEDALHPHERFSISITLLQIAIALASVTALTRKRWLMYGAALAAIVGSGLGGLAYFL
jgi:hypothetical protein